MTKKLTAFLIGIVMIFGLLPAYAKNNTAGPDLVITDIRINNPYFVSGSDIRFEIDVKNIGDEVCESGWIWFEAKSGAKKRDGGKTSAKWSKKYLYPGEKMTWSVIDFVAESDTIEVSVLCDSAYNITESDESNNYLAKAFKALGSNADLVITDISPLQSEFGAGDTVDVTVSVKNIGNTDLPYSQIEGELVSDNKITDFKTVQKLNAGEEISFTVNGIEAAADRVNIAAEINPERKITESDYSNNTYEKDIYSIEEISYDWSSVRIGGGGYVPHIALQKNDPDAVYIGTDVAGALRYNHSTEEWVPITNALSDISSNFNGVQAIETDPTDSNIVYAALGAGQSGAEGVVRKSGIFRSCDKGKTFTDMNVPPGDMAGDATKSYQSLLAVDPNNTNILYAVCPYDGLYRTENAKDKVPKWEKLNIPGFVPAKDNNGIMTGVAIDPNKVLKGKSSTIYASTKTGGIYRSQNGGASFELIPDSSLSCKMMKVVSNGDLYANVAMKDGGIVKYDGQGWISIAPYKDKEYSSFCVNPYDEKMLVAATTLDIYFSDNAGLTWRSVAGRNVSEHEFQAPWHPDGYFANHISFASFDPVNNKTVWFGDWFGVWKTEDITAKPVKWKSVVRGLEEFCVRNIKPTWGEARLFVGAMDNCGITTKDVFEFPTDQFNNPTYQDTNCIDFAEKAPEIVARIGGNGWGAKDGDGGYSTDGGFTWTPFETYPTKLDNPEMKANNGYLAVAAEPNDDGAATILATPIKHFVYRTTDYGKTWTKIESLPQNLYRDFNDYNDPIEADNVNKDVFYAYDAATGNFYLSENNGESFFVSAKLPKADRRNFVCAVPGAEGAVFVALGGEGLWYSTDYGKTFEKIGTLKSADVFSIGKEAPDSKYPTLYVYGEVNGVSGLYRSINFGKSWQKIKSKGDVMTEAPSTLKADRKDFGVFYTVKGGNGVNIAIPSDTDIKPPRVVINSKLDGTTVRSNPFTVNGTVTEVATVYVSINGREYQIKTDENNRFSVEVPLNEGENQLSVYAADKMGCKSAEQKKTFTHDPNHIELVIDQSSGLCMQKKFTLTGSVDIINKDRSVKINGESVGVNPKTCRFSYTAPIHEGINSFNVTAYDDLGNTVSKTIEMDYDTTPPSVSFKNSGITTDQALYMLEGTLSEPCTMTIGDYTLQLQQDESLDFKIPIQLDPGVNNLTARLTDPVGNSAEFALSAEYRTNEELPNDRSEVIVYNTSSGVPQIDGEILDGEWNMNRVANRLLSGNTKAYAVFGLKGDSKYLYFGARVWDDNVFLGGGSDYNMDTIELFFDPEMNRANKYDSTDHQVRLGVLNNSVTGVVKGTSEGVKMAYTLTSDGYIVEAAIPWEAVNLTYSPGMKFGFDVSINDNNLGANKTRDGAFGWQGTANNYYDTSAFGTAVIQ